jgi:3-hydroxybutyryl-CoA dehydrogenase
MDHDVTRQPGRREAKTVRKEIRTVAVIGAGTMGAQIAALAALSGRDVKLFDTSGQGLKAGFELATSEHIPNIVAVGMVSGTADEGRSRLSTATSLENAVDDADFVIEAIREDLQVKLDFYRALSPMTRAILATNSSSIRSLDIAPAVEQPERFLNMHFFAPVWVRSMVELMGCGSTSDDTMDSVEDFGRSMGLLTARVRSQSKGFIINRIWRAVKRESLRVVDEGVADPEDVDRLWMIFFETEHPPFGMMDRVGLDVVFDIEASYQRETLDPTDRPSETLRSMIASGELGEKTGKGFYTHPNPAYLRPGFVPMKSKSRTER